MIRTLFMHILLLSFVCSFFIAILIVIKKIVKKNYSANWYYIAWIFLAIRMILPFDFLFPFHLFTIPIENEINDIVVQSDDAIVYPLSYSYDFSMAENIHDYPVSEIVLAEDSSFSPSSNYVLAEAATESIAEATSDFETVQETNIMEATATKIATSDNYEFSFYSIIPYIWFFGVILFLSISIIQYMFFKRTIHRWCQRISDAEILDIFQTLCKDMQINTNVQIYLCKKVSTPMIMGFFHPVLLLPSENISTLESYFIIKHELVHLKHHDLWIKLLLLIANAVHFFNPLAYAMVYFANQEIEFSCDSEVIHEEPFETRKNYSQTILNSIQNNCKFSNSFTTSFIGNKNILKTRFQNIFDEHKKKRGIFSLTVLSLFILCSGILIACGQNNTDTVAEQSATVESESILASTLFQYKTDFIGDNIKVSNIVSNLQPHAGVTYDSIQLQTEEQPYQLSIYYTIDDYAPIKRKGAVSGEAFYNDAVILLSLIQNLDEVTVYLQDKENTFAGSIYSFPFKREDIEKDFNTDIRFYAKEETTFTEFLNNLYAVTEKDSAEFSSETAQIVEKNLQTIISNPKQSANPDDYIQAHRQEYETILKTGKEGLDYMLAQFESHHATGLKGMIMAKLCIELLGDQYFSSNNNWSTPEEWYDSLFIQSKTLLPTYEHTSKNTLEELTYNAILQQTNDTQDTHTVTIVAPKIIDTIKIDSETSIYTIVSSNDYQLVGDTLYCIKEDTIPTKIVYENNKLKQYIQAGEGGEFLVSIKEFCENNEQLVKNILSAYKSSNTNSDTIQKNIKDYVIKQQIPANYYENEKGEKINLF